MKNNKNKLLKLLIPTLALSAMNVNAMEKPVNRYNSIGKLRYRTNKFKEMDKFGEQRKNILVENINAVKKDNQGVIRYAGEALDKLKEAGYLLPEEKHRDIIKKYDFPTTRISAHGHTGSFVKCKKGNKWYGIKYDPNPNTTGIETFNNNTKRTGDYKRENQFYQDAKTLFKGKPWVTHQYDKFEDKFGTYRVVDYVKGDTMEKYCGKLKKETFLKRLEEFVDKGTQILNIVHDYEEQGKINIDLHDLNLMVTKDGTVKVVDHGKYNNLPPNREKANQKVTKAFKMAMTPLLKTLDIPALLKCKQKAIKYGRNYVFSHRYDSSDLLKAYVLDILEESLDDLNEGIYIDGKLYEVESPSYQNVDHNKRSRLINNIKLFLQEIGYSGRYELAKKLLES